MEGDDKEVTEVPSESIYIVYDIIILMEVAKPQTWNCGLIEVGFNTA